MFTHVFDEQARALVVIHWPGPWSDAGFQNVQASVDKLAGGADSWTRLVIVAKDGAPVPTPQNRKSILESIQQRPRCLCAVVSRAAEHRGIVTALSWVDPSLRDRHFAATTFEEACAWMSEKSGEDAAVLRRLFAELERNARRGSIRPS
jgi:hypothetical protein